MIEDLILYKNMFYSCFIVYKLFLTLVINQYMYDWTYSGYPHFDDLNPPLNFHILGPDEIHRKLEALNTT